MAKQLRACSPRCWRSATFPWCFAAPCSGPAAPANWPVWGDQASIDPDLAEWNYGSYEGLTPAAIHGQHPGWLVFRDGCPDGESPAEVGERVDRVIRRVRQNGGRVALFAHGHVFRVFVARWIELSPSHGAHFLLDTSTLTILSYYRGIPAVKCWNAPLPDQI
jgi:broad specificity phosphatase PhoE